MGRSTLVSLAAGAILAASSANAEPMMCDASHIAREANTAAQDGYLCVSYVERFGRVQIYSTACSEYMTEVKQLADDMLELRARGCTWVSEWPSDATIERIKRFTDRLIELTKK